MRSSIRYVGMGCLALLAFACGDKGDDNGTGGSAGSGGGAVTGGGAGTGGSAGTGGATGGAGGSSAGSGGSAGAGATADSGTGPADSGRPITQSYTFDTDVQMWRFQYTSVPPLMAGSDAGIPLLLPADIVVSQDPASGNPMPGALKVAINYSSRSQYVGVGISYGSAVASGVDLTGKILTAKIQLVSGLGTDVDLMTNPGGAKLYIKTGTAFAYASGAFTNIPTHGNWIDLDFDMDFTHTPPSFMAMGVDVSDVREIGIQFDTGGMSTTASPAVLLVDTVQY